jgi:dolichol-phosphate mannosyltransferase
LLPFDRTLAAMNHYANYAVVIPMANEEKDFVPLVKELTKTLDENSSGTVYFIIDEVSKDDTLLLCQELSVKDIRFKAIWAPENKNVVDAYIRGYQEALLNKHDLIIEMDAGLSHQPKASPMFLAKLNNGYECVFGSRFIKGGSMPDTNIKRYLLSKVGTILANLLLGTRLHDMTSGFQGFHAHIVKQFVEYPLLSKAHFYQTELRYLLRNKKHIEIPIQYQAPSPRVSKNAIQNSFDVLFFYFFERLKNKSRVIE